MDTNQTSVNNTDEERKKNKYLKNRVHINTYLNKRYSTDEAFREKRKAYNLEKNKQRYLNDPDFREQIKLNVKKYRERQKLIKLSLGNTNTDS